MNMVILFGTCNTHTYSLKQKEAEMEIFQTFSTSNILPDGQKSWAMEAYSTA